jgi:hypothetical protein
MRNFQRCFHLHFNADLITSNTIKEEDEMIVRIE